MAATGIATGLVAFTFANKKLKENIKLLSNQKNRKLDKVDIPIIRSY